MGLRPLYLSPEICAKGMRPGAQKRSPNAEVFQCERYLGHGLRTSK